MCNKVYPCVTRNANRDKIKDSEVRSRNSLFGFRANIRKACQNSWVPFENSCQPPFLLSKEKGPKSWRGARGIVGWGWRGEGYSLIWPNRVYTCSVDLTDYKVVILCNISYRVYLGTESHERMWKLPKCSSYVDMILVAPKITCFISSRDYKRLITYCFSSKITRFSSQTSIGHYHLPLTGPWNRTGLWWLDGASLLP